MEDLDEITISILEIVKLFAAYSPFHLLDDLISSNLEALETIVKFFICKIPEDLDETSASSPLCSLTLENIIHAPYILVLLSVLCCINLLIFIKYCSLWMCNRRVAAKYQNMMKITTISAKSSSYFDLAKVTISLELESIYCIIWFLTGWKAMERNNSLIVASFAEACNLIYLSRLKNEKAFHLLTAKLIVKICKYIHLS